MLPLLGKVKNCKRDAFGSSVGDNSFNLILDTRMYALEFLDKLIWEFAVSVLAESIFDQADSDGWDTGLIDEVVNMRKYP